MKVMWYRTIQFKLQMSIWLIFALCVGSILAVNYRFTQKDMARLESRNMADRYAQVIEYMDSASSRALSLSLWIANSKDIQGAFDRRDRQALEKLTSPIYEKIKTTINLSQFQFHLPPATSFLRLHGLSQYGDDLSHIRPTIVAVNQSQKAIKGLDRGRFGFGIRGLSPIFSDGRHIGSVEFGVSLNDRFLYRVKELYDSHVAIVTITAEGEMEVVAKNFPFSPPSDLAARYRTVLETDRPEEMMIQMDGRHVFYHLGPLKDFSGKTEGIVVVEKDITGMVHRQKTLLLCYCLGALGSLLIITLSLYFLFHRLLSQRIQRFSKVFQKAAKGDLTARSRVLKKDEMGMLGQMLNEFTGTLQANIKTISSDAGELNEASRNLQSVAQDLSTETDLSRQKAANVSDNAGKMSQDMHAVAAAMEELSANTRQIAKATSSMAVTVKDISKHTGKASEISSSAVEKVESASHRVDELGAAAQTIGQVSDTITDISEQTNLLALNATIEAARAGEAGRGFAVVAGEIKSLAQQTAGATEKIKESIGWIQSSAKTTVEDIKAVVQVINEVNEIITNISNAVETQAKTIEEIDNNVSQGASAIQEVSENVANTSGASARTARDIHSLSGSVSQISSGSSQVAASARQLSGLADKLQSLVGQFKVS